MSSPVLDTLDTLSWSGLLTVGGLLGGIAIFARNLLKIRQLSLKNRLLSKKLEEPNQLISEPTPEEISLYGKKFMGLKRQNILGLALLVIGVGAGTFMTARVTKLQVANEDLLTAQRLVAASLRAEGAIGSLNNLAILYEETGRFKEAQEAYQRALALAPSRSEEVAAVYNNMGHLELQMGKSKEALQSFQQALEIGRELGSRLEQITALSNLGVLHLSLSEARAAEEDYGRALELSRQLGDQLLLGRTLVGLANAKAEAGEYLDAERLYREALEVFVELGLANEEVAVVLQKLATTLEDMGRHDEAAAYYERAERVRAGERG